MENNQCWLQWAIELQSLAQAGLTYGKDVYDKERYERIREISAEMIAYKSDISFLGLIICQVSKVSILGCGQLPMSSTPGLPL